ncbi:MAG TPA: ABC transporter ATP-binding protein [Desulfobacteraceae bacterium]|nr:ABC transporter ATP-binding protein [Desulfobacteraceae bacterium]
MLKVMNLYFNYNDTRVLEGIVANVEKGRVLSIVGPNGTGKTTLLKCIAGILKPAAGTVVIDGHDADGMARRELAKHLGYVPQSMPVRFPATVFETVLAGRRPYIAWRPSRDDLERTAEIIEEMNLADLAMRDIDQLSGGQAQKVLLARALAQDTLYLLLDEPTSNLDLRHELEMLEVIITLAKRKDMGVLMAMHDLNLSARFSDTILMLYQGKIFCSGKPSEAMTPENIREVYGVEAAVRQENGYLQIQPLRCADLSPSRGNRIPPYVKDQED